MDGQKQWNMHNLIYEWPLIFCYWMMVNINCFVPSKSFVLLFWHLLAEIQVIWPLATISLFQNWKIVPKAQLKICFWIIYAVKKLGATLSTYVCVQQYATLRFISILVPRSTPPRLAYPQLLIVTVWEEDFKPSGYNA